MRVMKIISFILAIIMLSGNIVYAEESCSWYIKKRGNCIPDFPIEAELVSAHNGYFVDAKSNTDGKKVLYLTFDAGYENGNIERILDTLKSEGICGAFFILSNLIDKNPDLVRRMAYEGHLVCNHTSNHKDLSKATEEEIVQNLRSLEEKYEACVGRGMDKFFRFPEGRYSEDALIAVENAGYVTVFWSMAYDDWDNAKQPSYETAMRKMLDTTHDGAIILLHPTSKTNAQILPDLIKIWKAKGYTFGSLNDLSC